MSTLYCGIDVSKEELVSGGQIQESFENDDPAITAMLKRIAKLDGTAHVVCEATGGYEQKLVNLCHEHGILVSVVDPKRVRSFAKAHGKIAKTDRIDAQMITAFADSVKPKPTSKKSASRQQLDALVTRRVQIIEDVARHRTQTELASDSVVIATTEAIITALRAALETIEAEIKCVVSGDVELKEQSEALQVLIGIGPTVAYTFLATVPELGTVNRRTIANLIGIAPLNNDSGPKKGRRQIGTGRTAPRNTLYMAALVASRHCPKFSKVYQNLLKRGKPKKVALVAIMRRMLIVANSIMKGYYARKNQAAGAAEPAA